MRYVMRQKFFSWGDDFTIQDESGEDVFFVDGKAFSLGDQLSFQDMQGNELAFIRQKLMAWGPTYEIYSQGELRAVVKKSVFTFFHCSSAWTCRAPTTSKRPAASPTTSTPSSAGRAVATVSKQWFSWTDTYGVDVAEGEDDILILAATVVIDLACHKKKDDARGRCPQYSGLRDEDHPGPGLPRKERPCLTTNSTSPCSSPSPSWRSS